MVIYGTPTRRAALWRRTRFLRIRSGWPGRTALRPAFRFGRVCAPVLLAGFAGIGIMLARREYRRHALEWLFVAVPYLVVVTYVAMWWGGTS